MSCCDENADGGESYAGLIAGAVICLFLGVVFFGWSAGARRVQIRDAEACSSAFGGSNAVASTGGGLSNNRSGGAGETVRTLRFLELLREFFPAERREMLEKAIAEGVEKQPDRFAKLSLRYMELFGRLMREGKLGAYYGLLKKEHLRSPADVNLLRVLAAVASMPSMDIRDEYETWLAELAKVDSHEDVLFPYAKTLLGKGEAGKAYEEICRTVGDHPSEAQETLTNALRLFTEGRAENERAKIVERLKSMADLHPFHANSCGETLYRDGKLDDAAYFYRKCLNETSSAFYRELSDVKLCTIAVRQKTASDRTVSRLKDLAANSRTPVVRTDARRALISMNVDPPNWSGSSNRPKDN